MHRDASIALFAGLHPTSGCCGAHSLAEVYSTLTRMPGKRRISAEQAMLFVANIRERLEVIALTGDAYAEAMEFFADGASSGVRSMMPCWPSAL